MTNKLFENGSLGDIEVQNRVFMAPLTRNRAHPDGTPHEMAERYYAQRASAGLIISEATQVSPYAPGYVNTPAIYNEKQFNAWKRIVKSVHDVGGRIVLQLWHAGRISHNSLLPDEGQPLAPSEIQATADTFTVEGVQNASIPKALSVMEIEEVVGEFVKASRLAIDAGFDGVEVHGANGYLPNQFISTNSNKRDDQYGGSAENRSRFLIQIVDAVAEEIGSGKVGVRLSPTGTFNDIEDQAAEETYTYIYSELNKRNLAYLHVVERFPGYQVTDGNEQLTHKLRSLYTGNYIVNGDYEKSSATKVVDEGAFAVAFGRLFISNPDLAFRLETNAELLEPDQNTFYGGNEKGYSDYPLLSISQT